MANTWGYGAMTNSLGDIQNTKAIIIFGANPAVNHPVGFQHFLKAKERNNAKIIVIDPRFTKTAAKADLYAQIRPGTDIPFMYGMLNIILKMVGMMQTLLMIEFMECKILWLKLKIGHLKELLM